LTGACGTDHCVTCSDEAVPLRVVDVLPGGLALCGGDVEVMVDLVGEVAAGETLLVHAGVAIAKVEGAELAT
jgi:hydrogenase maturation factor